MKTIKSVQHLWQELQNIGFKYLNLRSLNQDGLENLFAMIWQFGGDNDNPTCAQFVSAFKFCVLNGYAHLKLYQRTAKMTMGNSSCPSSFVGAEHDLTEITNSYVSGGDIYDVSIDDLDFVEKQSVGFVSGYNASRLLTNKQCEFCRDMLYHQILKKDQPSLLHEMLEVDSNTYKGIVSRC